MHLNSDTKQITKKFKIIKKLNWTEFCFGKKVFCKMKMKKVKGWRMNWSWRCNFEKMSAGILSFNGEHKNACDCWLLHKNCEMRWKTVWIVGRKSVAPLRMYNLSESRGGGAGPWPSLAEFRQVSKRAFRNAQRRLR